MQKRAASQLQSEATLAAAQRDQLADDLAAVTTKLASEKQAAQAAANKSRDMITALLQEEELQRRKAEATSAQQEAQAAASRAAAVAAQLQTTEGLLTESRNELAAAIAAQKQAAERAAAAVRKVQQLTVALEREKAEAAKVQAENRMRLDAAVAARTAAEAAGVQARTELAKTRSRVTRLEADIANRAAQLAALEDTAASFQARTVELQDQLGALQLQLAAANGLVAELEAQKAALTMEKRCTADELEAERRRVAELQAAADKTAQESVALLERASGLEEELSATTELLHACKAQLHAETATSKALQVQVAALQDRVAQGAQQLAAAEEATSAAELRAAELSQMVTELQNQMELAEARTAEAQAANSASSVELAAATARVRDLEQQMDRLAEHLEKNEGELEAERSAKHHLRSELDELQEVHSKLEATAKSLKSSQEATARELVDSQGQLRELEAKAEKQREKALHYKQEAERAAAEVTSLRNELDKARTVAAATDAKVMELSTMIIDYESKSKDLDKKVQDATDREAALVRAADNSKTALTKLERDAQMIRREMAESGMRAAQMKHENLELNRTIEGLQAALDKARVDAERSLSLEQQITHLQNELAIAQAFQAQVEELKQQLAQRDRQLADAAARAHSRVQPDAGIPADGELELAMAAAGSAAGTAGGSKPKAEASAPKRPRATTAKNGVRRDTVKKAEPEATPAVTEPQQEMTVVIEPRMTVKSTARPAPVKREPEVDPWAAGVGMDAEDTLELLRDKLAQGMDILESLSATDRTVATVQAGLQTFSYDMHVKLGMEVMALRLQEANMRLNAEQFGEQLQRRAFVRDMLKRVAKEDNWVQYPASDLERISRALNRSASKIQAAESDLRAGGSTGKADSGAQSPPSYAKWLERRQRPSASHRTAFGTTIAKTISAVSSRRTLGLNGAGAGGSGRRASDSSQLRSPSRAGGDTDAASIAGSVPPGGIESHHSVRFQAGDGFPEGADGRADLEDAAEILGLSGGGFSGRESRRGCRPHSRLARADGLAAVEAGERASSRGGDWRSLIRKKRGSGSATNSPISSSGGAAATADGSSADVAADTDEELKVAAVKNPLMALRLSVRKSLSYKVLSLTDTELDGTTEVTTTATAATTAATTTSTEDEVKPVTIPEVEAPLAALEDVVKAVESISDGQLQVYVRAMEASAAAAAATAAAAVAAVEDWAAGTAQRLSAAREMYSVAHTAKLESITCITDLQQQVHLLREWLAGREQKRLAAATASLEAQRERLSAVVNAAAAAAGGSSGVAAAVERLLTDCDAAADELDNMAAAVEEAAAEAEAQLEERERRRAALRLIEEECVKLAEEMAAQEETERLARIMKEEAEAERRMADAKDEAEARRHAMMAAMLMGQEEWVLEKEARLAALRAAERDQKRLGVLRSTEEEKARAAAAVGRPYDKTLLEELVQLEEAARGEARLRRQRLEEALAELKHFEEMLQRQHDGAAAAPPPPPPSTSPRTSVSVSSAPVQPPPALPPPQLPAGVSPEALVRYAVTAVRECADKAAAVAAAAGGGTGAAAAEGGLNESSAESDLDQASREAQARLSAARLGLEAVVAGAGESRRKVSWRATAVSPSHPRSRSLSPTSAAAAATVDPTAVSAAAAASGVPTQETAAAARAVAAAAAAAEEEDGEGAAAGAAPSPRMSRALTQLASLAPRDSAALRSAQQELQEEQARLAAIVADADGRLKGRSSLLLQDLSQSTTAPQSSLLGLQLASSMPPSLSPRGSLGAPILRMRPSGSGQGGPGSMAAMGLSPRSDATGPEWPLRPDPLSSVSSYGSQPSGAGGGAVLLGGGGGLAPPPLPAVLPHARAGGAHSRAQQHGAGAISPYSRTLPPPQVILPVVGSMDMSGSTSRKSLLVQPRPGPGSGTSPTATPDFLPRISGASTASAGAGTALAAPPPTPRYVTSQLQRIYHNANSGVGGSGSVGGTAAAGGKSSGAAAAQAGGASSTENVGLIGGQSLAALDLLSQLLPTIAQGVGEVRKGMSGWGGNASGASAAGGGGGSSAAAPAAGAPQTTSHDASRCPIGTGAMHGSPLRSSRKGRSILLDSVDGGSSSHSSASSSTSAAAATAAAAAAAAVSLTAMAAPPGSPTGARIRHQTLSLSTQPLHHHRRHNNNGLSRSADAGGGAAAASRRSFAPGATKAGKGGNGDPRNRSSAEMERWMIRGINMQTSPKGTPGTQYQQQQQQQRNGAAVLRP
ncbi:hypothetical protein VOLCADRAFT_103827 [Volvox carteri f. nagariensis]|uniref:Uncharacterized protein n=1 Tax=Volvox carteri f. nagariensis TaxID=3068 RepID=D8TPG9_VOLCA|nr:uncharacterized protein VOLCADRAFT_103827 [Volvox carteri f. nagariensis]EFJ50762.1 hypothetical protein VOLCADRAFT_103827 [Volvox carteri f. nagariensis]|eukprot:XP_002948355.1 hypothetical protein VOLCADRAFT_103827 [Volvox carteri f. nagariensis]